MADLDLKGLKGRPLSTDLDADPGDLFFWMSQQDAITDAP